MTPEGNVVYVRGMLLQAEIRMQGMVAENKVREQQGLSIAYDEKAFVDLIEELGVHHNSLVTQLSEQY